MTRPMKAIMVLLSAAVLLIGVALPAVAKTCDSQRRSLGNARAEKARLEAAIAVGVSVSTATSYFARISTLDTRIAGYNSWLNANCSAQTTYVATAYCSIGGTRAATSSVSAADAKKKALAKCPYGAGVAVSGGSSTSGGGGSSGGSSGGSGSGGSSGGTSGGSSGGGGSGSGSSSSSTTYSCYDGSGMGPSNYQRRGSCTSSRRARSTFTCRTDDGGRDAIGNAQSAAECAWMRSEVRYDYGTFSCSGGGSRRIVSARKNLNPLELLSEIDDACGRNEQLTSCSGLPISLCWTPEKVPDNFVCSHGGQYFWRSAPMNPLDKLKLHDRLCPLLLDIARRIVSGSDVQADDLQVIQWRQTKWPTIGSGTSCRDVKRTLSVREGKILGKKTVRIKHCTDPEPEEDNDSDGDSGWRDSSPGVGIAPLYVNCPHTGTVITAAECELEGCRLGMVPHCHI